MPSSESPQAWEAELRAALALHDLAISGHELVGGQEAQVESARLQAVDVMDRAKAAGVTEQQLDAVIAAYRAEWEANRAE